MLPAHINHHTIIVDAICGVEPDMSLITLLERWQLGSRAPVQDRPWRWSRNTLRAMELNTLVDLYIQLRSDNDVGTGSARTH